MSLLESAVTAMCVMITVSGFHGVPKLEKESEPMQKINWDKVIVKTINWSCWLLLATLAVALVMVYLGTEKGGTTIGIGVGAYLLGWVVVMITAFIDDNAFKGMFAPRKDNGKKSAVKAPAELNVDAENNPEANVVQHHIRA